MNYNAIEQRVSDLITPIIKDLGYRLVLVKIGDSSVQILAESPLTRNLGVEDCKKISKAVSIILDVEDPIKGAYNLEVSSPGIDRPLVRIEDFGVYEGYDAKVETKVPTATGQKRFRGLIGATNGDMITITTEDQGDVELAFSALAKAKLVLTDELIKHTNKTGN